MYESHLLSLIEMMRTLMRPCPKTVLSHISLGLTKPPIRVISNQSCYTIAISHLFHALLVTEWPSGSHGELGR